MAEENTSVKRADQKVASVKDDGALDATSVKGEISVELKVYQLKQQKTSSKTALTKARNKLMALLDEEVTSHRAVRDAIDHVGSLQCKAVDVIWKLAKVYHEAGDVDKFKKTCQETDSVEEACEFVINKAQTFLDNTHGSTSSLYTGMHRLFRQEKGKPKMSAGQQSQTGVESVGNQEVSSINMPDKLYHKPRSVSSNHMSASKSETHPSTGNDMWKQLKRVSIPVFSGNVQVYEGWRAAFMACVDSAPATNEYKLLQLKQYLSGDAAQVVAKLGHSATAYDVALERLERKYGGRRRQIALKLEEVTNFKPLCPGNAKDLEKFADMLDVLVVSLRDSDKVEELSEGCLYSVLMKKMTESMIIQYQRWIFEQQRQESVETLREWVIQEAEFHTIASETRYGLFHRPRTDRKEHAKSGTFFGAQGTDVKQTCQVCQASNHTTWTCTKLKSLDVSQRWNKVKELGLCFRCLCRGHQAKTCNRTGICGIDSCRKTHNRLLHSGKLTESQELKHPVTELTKTQSSQTITFSTTRKQSKFSALRTVPVVVKYGSRRMTVNALLDDASTQTYINEDVVSELGIDGRIQNVSVNVLNSKVESFDSKQVEFGLESIDGSIDMTMTALTTTKVTGKMPVIDWQMYQHRWKHLEDINFPHQSSRPYVDLLIGMDYIMLHFSQQDVCGRPGEPVARLTPV